MKMGRAFLWLGALLTLLAIVLVAAYFLVDVNTFRPQIQASLGTALGRRVTLGKLHLDLLGGSLRADNIAIGDDPAFSHGDFINAKSFQIGVEMKPLIVDKQLHVTSMRLIQPQVALLRAATGNSWNFSSIGENSSPARASNEASNSSNAFDIRTLSIGELAIEKGQVTLGRQNSSARQVWKDVTLTAKNITYENIFPITMNALTPGSGTVRLSGTAGPLAEVADGTLGKTSMHLKLALEKIPAQDVQGLLGVLGGDLPSGSQIQGGTIQANLAIEGILDKLVTTGPITLSNVRMTGLNLAQRLSAVSALTGIQPGSTTDIQTLASQVRVAPEGVRADQINIVIPQLGTITGAGEIDAANRLNFQMNAKLAGGVTSALGRNASMLGGAGAALGKYSQMTGMGAGGNGLNFKILGTTSNPQFVPDMGSVAQGVAGQLLQKQGNGGLSGVLGGLFGQKKKP